jgi:putative two-component system response regulator
MKREIPLAARIMALADSYEEMTAVTIEYPGKLSHDEAADFIIRNTGLQFDPMITQAFITMKDEFNAIRERLSER